MSESAKRAALPPWEEEQHEKNTATDLTDIFDIPVEDEDHEDIVKKKKHQETGRTSPSSNAVYYFTASHLPCKESGRRLHAEIGRRPTRLNSKKVVWKQKETLLV